MIHNFVFSGFIRIFVGEVRSTAFNLHVLGTPPTLILSQDQTLQIESRDDSIIDPDPPTGGESGKFLKKFDVFLSLISIVKVHSTIL